MKKKTKWLTGIGLLLVVVVLGFVFKWEIYTQYENIANNHYSSGDKVYSKDFYEGRRINEIPLWRLIGPIDKTWEAKPYVIKCTHGISSDSLIRRGSSYLGTYNKHEILNIKATNGKFVFTNFYAITPVYTIEQKWFEREELPAGYAFIDSNRYVIAFDVINKDAPMFLKK